MEPQSAPRAPRTPPFAAVEPFPVRLVPMVSLVSLSLTFLGASGTALGYVRARDEQTSAPFFWSDPRKVFELANPPAEALVSVDDLRAAAEAAALSWSSPTIACTGVALGVARDATDSQISGYDHRNRIIMTVGNWCRRDATVAFDCVRDPSAVALTTYYTRHHPGAPDDGEIQEADIEVNDAGNFQWGAIPDGPISGRDFANTYDLTSVLTHEMGHFIGLGHTCQAPGDPLLIDDTGVATPLCNDVPTEEQSLIEDATMYPFMNPADVKLRTLTADDVRAACEIYPPSALPYDEWVGSGGCSQAVGTSSGGPVVPVFVFISLAVFALFSRRARRVHNVRVTRNSAPTPRNRQFG